MRVRRGFRSLASVLIFAAAFLLTNNTAAQTKILRSRTLDSHFIYGAVAPNAHYGFSLRAVVLKNAGWRIAEVAKRIRNAAEILRQCDVSIHRADIMLVAAPENMRKFASPFTAEAVTLAQQFSNVNTPVLYFVDSVRDGDIAFAARYTIVRHLGLHPALRDSIWITQTLKRSEQARMYMRYYFSDHDVVAHEIAHVLGDLGHVYPTHRNLMHQSAAYLDNSLTVEQCRAIRTRNFYVHFSPVPAYHAGNDMIPAALLPPPLHH
ncbi:MAG: hypothetical protein ACREVE_14280 [Gammaproteobacteria bacterium]